MVIATAAFATLLPGVWQLAVLTAAVLLGAGLAGPRWLLTVLLLSAGVSLAPITDNQRALFTEIGGFNLDGLRLLATVAGLGLCLNRLSGLRDGFKRALPYSCFIAYCGLTVLWSSDRTDGVRLLLKLSYPLVGYFLAFHVARIGDVKWTRISLCVGAIVASGLYFALEVLSTEPGSDWFAGRYRGGIGYNLVGHYSAITCLIMYAWWRSSKMGPLAFVALFLAFQCVATGSRTAVASLGVGFLAYELAMGRWRTAVTSTVGLVGVWLLIPTLGERTLGSGGVVAPGYALPYLEQVNMSGRMLIWADVWNGMVRFGEPWGQGLGASAAYLANRYETIRHVHSEYLRLIAETGVGGLGLFTLAYAAISGRLLRGLRLTGETRVTAAVALGGVAMYLCAGLAENTFELFAIYGIFPWVLIGLAFGTMARAEQVTTLVPAR